MMKVMRKTWISALLSRMMNGNYWGLLANEMKLFMNVVLSHT